MWPGGKYEPPDNQETMSKRPRGGVLVVHCACGVVMRGTESELVLTVQKHALENHNMKATREEVLSRARPES
jgi:hypothetical protein